MKHNEILTHFAIEANIEKTIELDRIYPLGIIEYKGSIDVQISCDNKSFERCNITSNSFKDVTAKYIKLTSSISQEITIYLGLGYYAETNPTMSKTLLLQLKIEQIFLVDWINSKKPKIIALDSSIEI